MNRTAVITLLSTTTCAVTSGAVEVILDYEAEALTVVGTPFGLNVPRLTIITGSFVYETAEAPDLNGSPERGWYQLSDDGGFTATFLDNNSMTHTLTGSVSPWLEVEDILVSGGPATIDTFRFWDGDDRDTKGGLMKFDGVENGGYFLTFAMTDDSGAAHPDDSLPEVFPMTGVKGPVGHPFPSYPFPHTFVIGDGSGFEGTGRMLLQLNWLSQRGETPTITAAGFAGGHFIIEFTSEDKRTYTIEFSTDLNSWDPIATGVPATGASTSFSDSEVVTRLGAFPDAAYYRVRRE